jgi:tetratricopeptide (TPR) repeat protein
MKICPFISHMLGEENSNVLISQYDSVQNELSSVPDSSDLDNKSVLILGYDGDDGNVQTKTLPETSIDTSRALNLSCLKESCRFYGDASATCMFEQLFEMMQQHGDRAQSEEDATTSDDRNISKELDKFWTFQTKSVAEMIASIGEAEKNQKERLDGFQVDINKTIESMLDQGEDDSNNELRNEISKFHKAMEERDEVVENFSTSISEMVINIDEGLSKLGEKIEQFSNRLEKLDQVEEEFSSWRGDIEPQIKALADQQVQWENHFTTLKEQQDELMKFAAKETQRIDSRDELLKKKESKKLNNLGVTSFHNGALEMAKEQFQRAVDLDESSAEAFNNLGLVYTELKQEENASDAFKKAIELNPELCSVYTNLGYVFYKQGSYEQAIEMYNEALGKNSNSGAAYTNLGNAYYKLDKIDEAREAWNKAIDIDPGNEKAKRLLKRLS